MLRQHMQMELVRNMANMSMSTCTAEGKEVLYAQNAKGGRGSLCEEILNCYSSLR